MIPQKKTSCHVLKLGVFQNDCLNLSCVKDINVAGNKMTRSGRKMTISKSCIFFNQTDFTNGNKSRFTRLESFPPKLRVLECYLIIVLAPMCSFFFFLVRLVSWVELVKGETWGPKDQRTFGEDIRARLSKHTWECGKDFFQIQKLNWFFFFYR